MSSQPDDPLLNPVWSSLLGPHSALAVSERTAHRFQSDVAPFAAIPAEPNDEDWAAITTLLARTGQGWLVTPHQPQLPAALEVARSVPGFQMTGTALAAADDPAAELLGPDDVPAMLELVRRTEPGPFFPRTIELGRYLGFRSADGALIAMAGERLQPTGWTEISAVCTDPAHRGRGLADRLIRAVAAGVRQRGDQPFLHVAGSNVGAVRLYERMGFVIERDIYFTGVQLVE